MEVGDNGQNHSEYSVAAIMHTNQGHIKQERLCVQKASVSLKGENQALLEDKENSLPYCSDNQPNSFECVQSSPAPKKVIEVVPKSSVDIQVMQTNSSSPRVEAMNRNSCSHGSVSNPIVDVKVEVCEFNQEKNSIPVQCSSDVKLRAEVKSEFAFQDARAETSTPRVRQFNRKLLLPVSPMMTIPDNSRDENVNICGTNQKSKSPLEAMPVNDPGRFDHVTKRVTESNRKVDTSPNSGRKSIINWDDLDVGNFEIDHSQNFFTRHAQQNNIGMPNKDEQNSFGQLFNNSYNTQNTSEDLQSPILDEHAIVDRKTQSLDETVKPLKKPPNTVFQWSTQKTVVCKTAVRRNNATGAANSMPPPPRAYVIKDVYEQKKQQKLERLLQEEREKRIFHSRPVPDFNACHKQLEQKFVRHLVTLPVTPKVLKHSRQAEEKRKEKLEEWKRQNPPFKFESRDANVLKEVPFKPTKLPTTIEPRPFNLRTEHRLQDRKKYDEATKFALKEKQKQEEEKRKTAEEELVKELRKRATFKARPNPFKHK